MPRRQVPLAMTTSNAAGIRSVYQDRIFNMYPERSAFRDNQDRYDTDLHFALRSVSGERLAVSPRRVAEAVGVLDGDTVVDSRLLGFFWAEHHNIPQFQNKLGIIGSQGVALLDPEQSDEHGLLLVESTKAAEGESLGSGEVVVASSGFSWLITQPSTGKAWVYQPEPPDSGVKPYVGALSLITVLDNRQGLTPTQFESYAKGKKPSQLTFAASNQLNYFGPAIFAGGRYLVASTNSGRFFWSGVAGTFASHVFFADAVAAAEQRGDPLTAITTDHKLLYMLGTRTVEQWYVNTTNTGVGPIAHAPGSDIARGCVGPFAYTSVAGTALWLSHDGSVFGTSERGGARRITSPGQAEMIESYVEQVTGSPTPRANMDETRMFAWEENGHDFVAVRTPTGWTNIIDLGTGLIFQRGDDPGEPRQERRPWRMRDVVSSTRSSAVFARTNNAIFMLTPSNPIKEDEDGERKPTRRRVTTPLMENDREDMSLNRLTLLVQGVSNADQTVGLQVSRSRGLYWDEERKVPLVPGRDVDFQVGGTSSDLNFRISHESREDFSIFGMYADVTPRNQRHR